MNCEEFNEKAHASLEKFRPKNTVPDDLIIKSKPDRPYQIRMYNKFFDHVKNGMKIISAEVGCGLGKTRLAILIALYYLQKGQKILFLSPNPLALGDINVGNIKDWHDHPEAKKYCIATKKVQSTFDSVPSVNFCSLFNFVTIYDTCKEHFDDYMSEVGLLILDEVHRMPNDKAGETVYIGKVHEIVRNLKNTQIFTCTATHLRMDGLAPMGKERPDKDMKFSIADGIMEGICPDIHFQNVHVDIDCESKVCGDTVEIQFTDSNGQKYINQIVRNFYRLHQMNPKQAHVFFVQRVSDAKDFTEALNKIMGYTAFKVMVADTDIFERLQIAIDINDFKLLGYVTVNVGGEGVNIPRLEVAHLISRTTSHVKLAQNIGRITRQYKTLDYEKKTVLVVDYMIMKKDVLKVCKGSWDYAEREGSSIAKDRNNVPMGASLFTETKRENPLLTITYGDQIKGLTQAGLIGGAEWGTSIQAYRDRFMKMKREGKPKPTGKDWDMLHNFTAHGSSDQVLDPGWDNDIRELDEKMYKEKGVKRWFKPKTQVDAGRAKIGYENQLKKCYNVGKSRDWNCGKLEISFNEKEIEKIFKMYYNKVLEEFRNEFGIKNNHHLFDFIKIQALRFFVKEKQREIKASASSVKG